MMFTLQKWNTDEINLFAETVRLDCEGQTMSDLISRQAAIDAIAFGITKEVAK